MKNGQKSGIIIKNRIRKGGIFMESKYKLTPNLSSLINDLREKCMGYTHEEFAKILNIESSTSYYMCKNIRMNSITPEKLIAIFAVDYNMHLFIQKKDEMERLLENAITAGKIQPKMTLRKVFGNKAKIVESFNSTLCKPPVEIFTEQKCLIDRKYFVPNQYDAKIFDEELFSEEMRYVKIPSQNDLQKLYNFSMWKIDGKSDEERENEKKRLEKSKKELERIQQHIIYRIERILSVKKQDQDYLKQEYWLLAFYFLYKDVKIYGTGYEFIKKCYLQNGQKVIEWLPIFKTLGRNEHIGNPTKYKTEDCLYFRDNKGNDITKDNLPVFYYKYRTSYKDGNSKSLEKYFRHYYFEEQNNACGLNFKLVHLFSIISQYYLSIGKTEDEAFKATCIKLYLERVELPFIKTLELFNLPERKDAGALNSETFEFCKYVAAYFKNKNISDKEKGLIKFKDNFFALNSRFFDVIAVDFEFIKKLNTSYDAELNEILNKTTQKYKEDNLID